MFSTFALAFRFISGVFLFGGAKTKSQQIVTGSVLIDSDGAFLLDSDGAQLQG